MIQDVSPKLCVLGFSGPIASGKSTLISLVAKKTECCVASYGAYVRSQAEHAGLGLDRSSLQHLSSELLKLYSHSGLTSAVIENAHWDRRSHLIIDGIRHSSSVDEIRRRVAPVPFFLVFVATPDNIRVQRILHRDGISAHEVKLHDDHETESEANFVLKDIADIIVDGTDLEMASSVICSFLQSA